MSATPITSPLATDTTMTNPIYLVPAKEFLARNGIGFRATLSDSKTADWEPSGHHYRVTLWRIKERESDSFLYKRTNDGGIRDVQSDHPGRVHVGHVDHPQRLVFDFWGSKADADKGEHPSAYDVLACLSSDVNTPETFKDFCSEYGYDADSLKALQVFRRCDRFGKRLRAFFTAKEIEELSEIQ